MNPRDIPLHAWPHIAAGYVALRIINHRQGAFVALSELQQRNFINYAGVALYHIGIQQTMDSPTLDLNYAETRLYEALLEFEKEME